MARLQQIWHERVVFIEKAEAEPPKSNEPDPSSIRAKILLVTLIIKMYPTSTRELLSNSNNNQSFSPSRSSTIAQQSSNTTHFGGISNNSFGSSSAMGTTSFANSNESREIQQQFTPNFLFGNQQPSNRRSFATPTRHLLPSYGSPGILKHREPLNSGNSKNVHWSPVLVRGRSRSKSPEDRKMQRLSTNAGKSASSTLWNGPPLRSLNEDILGPPEKQSRIEMPEPLPMPTTTNLLTNINQQQQQPSAMANSSVGEENGREIIELDDGEEEDIYWVTVFGFQPAQRDDILELFSRHGDIMAQKSPKQGNWLHIRYSSPIHAKQALAKNATIFHGQMIGVAQCMDRDTMDQESANQQFTTPIIPQSSAATAMNKSANLNGSLMEKDNSLLLNGSPLVPSTSAYKSSASIHHNTSLPSRARLSISSRAGMRPLNSSSFISADGSLNHSMDNNSFQGNQKNDGGGADDSFIGKIWNLFGGGANGN